LVVTVPKEIVESEGIKEGEVVLIDIRKAKKSWFGIASGVGSFTVADELKVHD
jgi:bifunctional DNA-binding transcriptional regulator/antitoxin component of YhaV-PrlF toxin-antitoxin module